MQHVVRPVTLGAAAALLFSASFFGGGAPLSDLYWIGVAAIAAAGAAWALVLVGAVPRPALRGAGLACVLLLAGLVCWLGLTMAWSIAGDRSWAYFDRGLAYLAFLALGLVCAALVPLRAIAAVLAGLLALVLLWALAGKTIPALFEDGARVSRLREPIGYWNALALAAATAVPLALWLRRSAGAALLYLAALVLLLTYSRGGIVVAVLAAAGFVLPRRDRLERLALLAVVLPVAGGVAAWAFTRPALTDDGQPYQARVDDGAWFGLIALGGLALAVAAVRFVPLERLPRRAAERGLAALAVAAVLGAGIGVVVAEGGPARLVDDRQVEQGPGRFGDVSSSNRWTWWQEAWAIFEERPAGGTGAATFELARRPIRESAVVANEPHSLALQALAETGLFGFLLLAVAAVGGAAAAVRTVHRHAPAERAPALALALGVGAYALHSLADVHFDFLGVSAPAFFVLGALLPSGTRPIRRPALAVAPVVVALGAAYSLTAPWLSERYVDDAYEAMGTPAAVSDAKTARSLDPLAVEPLHALALAEASLGNLGEATRRYAQATELQPENPNTWYALGAWEFELGNWRSALLFLDRAYGLDPWGPTGQKCGLLDQARAKVEQRECE